MQRGFTLLELSAVLAIMAAMVATGVVTYSAHIRAAHTSEAVSNVRLLADLVRSHPGGPVACAPSPPEVPRARPAPWVPSAGCRALGFSPVGHTRFQYSVQVPGPAGSAFAVVAAGDLDGDGEYSRFMLRADRVELEVERGLE